MSANRGGGGCKSYEYEQSQHPRVPIGKTLTSLNIHFFLLIRTWFQWFLFLISPMWAMRVVQFRNLKQCSGLPKSEHTQPRYANASCCS